MYLQKKWKKQAPPLNRDWNKTSSHIDLSNSGNYFKIYPSPLLYFAHIHIVSNYCEIPFSLMSAMASYIVGIR